MQNRTKRLLAALLALTLLCGLAACGAKTEEETTTAAPATTAAPTTAAEAATTASKTTLPSTTAPATSAAAQPLALYQKLIDGYPKFRADRVADWGYQQTEPIDYAYAIRDINGDGVQELILFDGAPSTETFGALYTLDGTEPVEVACFVRHGSYWINADGYLIYEYKWMTVEKLVGTELQEVAQPKQDMFSAGEAWGDYQEAFLKENGISTEPMAFDYTYLTGAA
ncbi:MAG: hypothetical protein IKD72_03865 [Clostridia bacterium]|nr:hypothetical protein [Clostridia bacterium]